MRMQCMVVLMLCVLIPAAVNAGGPSDVPVPQRTQPVENLIQVSWGDQIVLENGDGRLDTPEKVRRCIDNWHKLYHGSAVLWRGASYYLERYYHQRGPDNMGYRGKVKEVMSRFDPLVVARERTRENGQKLLIYMTFLDHGAPSEVLYGGTVPFPWQDRFTIEHPEFQAVDLRGNHHHGVLELAYPEARRLMVERMEAFIRDYDTDGVYVCSRTHSLPALHADQYGFSPPIIAEMKRRHGVDITTDPRFDYQSERFSPNDPLVEAWRRLRGEYLIHFYRELRQAIPEEKLIYAGIPRGRYLGPPYGNLYLDWEALLNEKLVDGLVLRVTSTKDLHPPLYVPHAQIGYLSSEDDGINIPSIDEAVNSIYGPLARANEIPLFCNTTFYGRQQVDVLERLADLRGVMLWSPMAAPNRARIAHDDRFCFPEGQMTIQFRLYLNPRPQGHQRVLSKYDHQEDATRGWECLIASGGKLQFRVNQVDPDTGRGKSITLTTPQSLAVEQWLDVGLVFSRPDRYMRVYVDGEQLCESQVDDLPIRVNPRQDIYLGRNGGWIWHYLDGKVDELRFTAEALDLSQQTGASEPAKMIARYRFDEVQQDGRILNGVDAAEHPMQLLNMTGAPLSAGASGTALDLSLERNDP